MRWVPIVPPPLWEANDKNVTTAIARGIGRFTIPLLAEFGHLSLQPTTSGSAEPAAMATEAPADPPEDPLPPLLEFPVLKDDNILVDDDQSMPALAKMVE